MKTNILLLATIFLVASAMATEPKDVVITGERSADNPKDFIWTITNNGDQPIVLFRARHYLGKERSTSENWVEGEMTGHIGHGQAMRPGFAEYKAADAKSALRPGRSMTCMLRLDNRSLGVTAKQTVQVVLADGTELDIPNVLCPAKESFLEQNLPLIGLGVMFGIFVLYKVTFGKKKPANPSATEQSANEQSGT